MVVGLTLLAGHLAQEFVGADAAADCEVGCLENFLTDSRHKLFDLE